MDTASSLQKRLFIGQMNSSNYLPTGKTSQLLTFGIFQESLIPQLIVVPLSSREVDGVRKEKEKLTAAFVIKSWRFQLFLFHSSLRQPNYSSGYTFPASWIGRASIRLCLHVSPHDRPINSVLDRVPLGNQDMKTAHPNIMVDKELSLHALSFKPAADPTR